MKIDSYFFGRIVINGKSYMKDVIIFPDRVFSPWWRKEGHLLHMEDLEEVVNEKPDILIIGRGYAGVMRVPEGLVSELEAMGMEVIVSRTPSAVDIFNNIEGKKAVAALHLTC